MSLLIVVAWICSPLPQFSVWYMHGVEIMSWPSSWNALILFIKTHNSSSVTQNSVCISQFPPACYVCGPSHPRCNNTNSVSGNERIMKLLNIQLSPVFYCVIHLRSKYSPKHFILKQFQFMC
jgi:hypothetical protein